MPNLKFLASTIPEIWRDPKIPKLGHVTPLQPPLTEFFSFFSLVLLGVHMRSKFKVSSFKGYGGGPKIPKLSHVTQWSFRKTGTMGTLGADDGGVDGPE